MRRDPIGIVGLISAWNYPLNVAFRKVAPALIAGNCAILKPSELAGLTCMFLGQVLAAAAAAAAADAAAAAVAVAGEDGEGTVWAKDPRGASPNRRD